MIEWDAQSIERQQIILWYILKEVKKIRGLDSTTNDANTFTNPFNDNFDDLKDLGFKPNEVLHASGNQRPAANKRLTTNGPVFANEHVFTEEAVPADERLSAVERMSADEFINANNPSSSNSTLLSVCTLLSLPPTRSQVSYRSINYIITNLL